MAKILVIEDNPTNLDLIVYLLEAFGHTPLAASSGADGLEAARRDTPDLIVCDVQMPDIDGYEVARQLKNHPALESIPLVAVTAYAMVGDRDKMLASGFDGYIAKPVAPETFVHEVERFLPPDQHSTLPPPKPAPATEALPRTAVDRRATILVVDNSPVNRSLIRSTLEPAGFHIVEAHSVRHAMGIARQEAPNLILSDLHMPIESGYDFVRIIKEDELLCQIPFVFISSTGMFEKSKSMYKELGAVDFILRPIEPQLLLAKIERCLNLKDREK